MACAATEHMGDFIAAKVAQALGMDEALEQLIVFKNMARWRESAAWSWAERKLEND